MARVTHTTKPTTLGRTLADHAGNRNVVLRDFHWHYTGLCVRLSIDDGAAGQDMVVDFSLEKLAEMGIRLPPQSQETL